MSSYTRASRVLAATLCISLSPLATAWTPYGYGPYDPGYYSGYPGESPPAPESYQPAPPQPTDPASGHSAQSAYPYGGEGSQAPYGEVPGGIAPPEQAYPGYGPWSGPSLGYPGSRGRGFGPPAGFRISRGVTDDAYTLTIGLEGMAPEEVQVRTEGQAILISRERLAQQVQKDSFDDGRGFVRSFSYSSGTTSRRLSVPRDADLSAMSREDREGSIFIRIPRRSY